MKNTISILLLSILFAAQYAKHLSYMGCRLFNMVTKDAVMCDCEKAFTKEKTPPTDEHNSTIHKHVQIDEYLKIEAKKIINIEFLNIETQSYSILNCTISTGFHNQLHKPPEA